LAGFKPHLVINQIWSGAEWRLPQSGVRGVAIEYDDGFHQSVHVCVDAQPCYLTLSVKRFRNSIARISFFYSRPPKGLDQQSGTWEAHPAGSGCCLRLVRNVRLQRNNLESDSSFSARESAYGSLLADHLGRVLDGVLRRVAEPR
jgi:hypothetical protein